jgi:hypothetical protein
MISRLSEYSLIAFPVWGLRQAVGYLRQDPSNLAWRV